METSPEAQASCHATVFGTETGKHPLCPVTCQQGRELLSSGGLSDHPPLICASGKTLWLWICSDHWWEVFPALSGWHTSIPCSWSPEKQRLQSFSGHVVGGSHHLRQVGIRKMTHDQWSNSCLDWERCIFTERIYFSS